MGRFIPLDMDREAGILGGSFTPCFHLPQGLPGPSRLGFPWGMLMLGPGESCPSVPKAPVHSDIRIFPHFMPYSLGCGASCDLSDLLA